MKPRNQRKKNNAETKKEILEELIMRHKIVFKSITGQNTSKGNDFEVCPLELVFWFLVIGN
jgi:hypothetical protein